MFPNVLLAQYRTIDNSAHLGVESRPRGRTLTNILYRIIYSNKVQEPYLYTYQFEWIRWMDCAQHLCRSGHNTMRHLTRARHGNVMSVPTKWIFPNRPSHTFSFGRANENRSHPIIRNERGLCVVGTPALGHYVTEEKHDRKHTANGTSSIVCAYMQWRYCGYWRQAHMKIRRASKCIIIQQKLRIHGIYTWHWRRRRRKKWYVPLPLRFFHPLVFDYHISNFSEFFFYLLCDLLCLQFLSKYDIH